MNNYELKYMAALTFSDLVNYIGECMTEDSC